jgi:hypothetical protein
VSVGAVVEQVEDNLRCGHALFSESPASASAAGSSLAIAGEVMRCRQQRVSGLSGAGPLGYTRFASDAGPALDAAAATDTALNRSLRYAADTNHFGRRSAASVLDGAASDTATLTPAAVTPAGQRALICALRDRLAQQQHVITAYEMRSARMAEVVHALRYRRRGSVSGGIPSVGAPFGRSGGSSRGRGLSMGRLPGGAPTTTFVSTTDGAAARSLMAGLAPPATAGTPLGTLTVNSGPREVAAAIIHEAQRRGYSPYQTTAILADAMQESNLSPKAKSPNGLWESIFQQDASYPGRQNPNLAIAEFFNRLDRHGGPSSRDIWKSIFWLQQRPGDPSAEAAYARGRRAYLSEIQSQHRAAVALYRELAYAAAL